MKFRFSTEAVARFQESTGPAPVRRSSVRAIGTFTRLKKGAETEIFVPVTASLSTGNVVPSTDVNRPYGIRNVTAETASQKIACAPYEDDCPMVSMARMAQTVKKIRSNRNSDFRSLRFSARTSADVSSKANAYPPLRV